ADRMVESVAGRLGGNLFAGFFKTTLRTLWPRDDLAAALRGMWQNGDGPGQARAIALRETSFVGGFPVQVRLFGDAGCHQLAFQGKGTDEEKALLGRMVQGLERAYHAGTLEDADMLRLILTMFGSPKEWAPTAEKIDAAGLHELRAELAYVSG